MEELLDEEPAGLFRVIVHREVVDESVMMREVHEWEVKPKAETGHYEQACDCPPDKPRREGYRLRYDEDSQEDEVVGDGKATSHDAISNDGESENASPSLDSGNTSGSSECPSRGGVSTSSSGHSQEDPDLEMKTECNNQTPATPDGESGTGVASAPHGREI